MNFSDSELLSGLVSQDEIILRAFYSKFFHQVRRYVLSNNGSDEDARDLFQDVLLVLFQKVRKADFKLTCALATYIYSVARFLWLKELNKRKWISYQEVDQEDYADVDADIGAINEKNERLLFFRRCFDKLSEACRKVLTLFNEGLSIIEITKVMGYTSEQHTKNRRYRCKQSLIQNIKAEYDFNTMSYGNNTNH
jgi:RNA polymerase sigma factor (sigma-70 family)